MIADEDAAFFRRQHAFGSFHDPSIAHHDLGRPPPVHIGARVDRVLQYRSNERHPRQLPFDRIFSIAAPIYRQTHLVADEPQLRLARAPGLTVFCKHQLNRRLNPQIRIFDNLIVVNTLVSRRYDPEQLSAPRLLFLPTQESIFENFQFHDAQCPLDAQDELIVHRGQIV